MKRQDPKNLDEWAQLLGREWEERARSSSRDFFVASHPGWEDPDTWIRYAKNEIDLFLVEIDREALRTWRVLEIGCGSGRLAELLHPMVADYTGIDISRGMVDAARERCTGVAHARFLHCDGTSIPAEARDRAYELVLAAGVFIHCPRDVIGSLVQSAWPLVKPTGQLRFQVLADPADPTGIEVPPEEAVALQDEVATVAAEITDEERRLSAGPHYLGHRFRHGEVAPFFEALTGGRVATYRGDPAAIYGLVEKPPPSRGPS